MYRLFIFVAMRNNSYEKLLEIEVVIDIIVEIVIYGQK